MLAYQAYVAETVTRRRVRRRLYGRRMLVYFGYPQAHVACRRARRSCGWRWSRVIRARLALEVALQIRIGIATGLVVVGNLASKDEAQQHGIVGGTPNLAAAWSACRTEPVVIEPTTHPHRGLFDTRPRRGDAQGLRRARAAWQVTGPQRRGKPLSTPCMRPACAAAGPTKR